MKTITIEEAIKNGNDGQNQDIKGQFIGKYVHCNVNIMAEYILRQSFEDNEAPFSTYDIENYYSYPEFMGENANFEGGTEEERDAEIERLRELQDEFDKDEPTEEEEKNYDTIRDEISELENLETESAEIFEWWMVDSWFLGKLKEQGECVIEAENIWGRCTSGQAILLDHVITKICAEMEILEGQANSWAKK